MRKIYYLLLFSILFPAISFSQEPCYDILLADGIQMRRDSQYAAALNQFWAAFECRDLPQDHRLKAEIEKVQDQWIRSLTVQAQKARAAQKKAEEAEKKAKESEEKEAEARVLAEKNEQKARQKTREIESLRLSLLANKVQSQGKADTALYLAYLGLQLWPDDSLSSKMEAFATAVRDSFEQAASDPGLLLGAQPLSQGKGVIAYFEGATYLLDSAGQRPVRLPFTGEAAQNAIYTSDGSMALAFASNNNVQLWSRSSINDLKIAKGHEAPLLAGAFNASQTEAITCSRDHTARLWDTKGNAKATLTGHEGNVYEASFSPGGTHFLTRSSDGTVRVWNQGGTCTAVIKDDKGYIYHTEFAPDGQQLITAGASGTIALWDLNGKQLATNKLAGGPILEAYYISGGTHVLCRSLTAVHILDNNLGKPKAVIPDGHPIKGMRWYADHELLFCWDYDGQVFMLSPHSSDIHYFTGHKGAVIDARLSPDGTQILTTATDGTTRLWNKQGNTLISWNLQSQNPLPAFFADDGASIYTAQNDNHELKLCPNPNIIYQEMKLKENDLNDTFTQLKEDYNLYLGVE